MAICYSKHGRHGIVIQSRRGGADWADLAIATKSLYEDQRPMMVPGKRELREYRFRFWDKGNATGDWSDVTTVTVGI